MTKLIVLITIAIILLFVFIIILIYAIIKKSKRLLWLSALSLALLFCTGTYTLYYGLKKGKEKTLFITRNAFEKAFPKFDSETPDTESNKKHFSDFLKVNITPDVKNIYCFDDTFGQDADFMFAFNCDSLTTIKIIEQHLLKKDSLTGNNSESLQHDFFWWDKKKIRELKCYSWDSNNKGKNVHKRFWYNQKLKKAYYFEFDL